MKNFALTFFVLVVGSAACSSSATSRPASASCSADSDCSSGACLDLAVFTDGGCHSAGKACSKACTNDADCASLGAKFMCFGGCDSKKSCGATP